MEADKKLELVYGYIQAVTLSLDVPVDIIHLVNQFLVFCDHWDISYKSEYIEINSDNNTITPLGSRVGTAYGTSVIDRSSGVQTWKLKILNYINTSGWFITVGIVEDDDKWLRTRMQKAWWRQHKGYGFFGGHGKTVCTADDEDKNKWTLYGEKFKAQDATMEVILNLEQGTLRYLINEKDHGNAFDNIDKTKKYRFVVSISRNAKGTVLELS